MSDQYENQDVRRGQSKTAVNGSKMSEETITSKVKKVADNLKNKKVDLDAIMLEHADKLAGTGAEQGNM